VHSADEEADPYGEEDYEFVETPNLAPVRRSSSKSNLTKSQPVPRLVTVSPIERDGQDSTHSSPRSLGALSVPKKKSKEKAKKPVPRASTASPKELNPIIIRNKRLASSGGAVPSAPSSISRTSEVKPVPVIKRVNNYVEVLPVAKKFGVYGCLDSTKGTIGKVPPDEARVPGERRGTKDLSELGWPEELSIMDGARLDSLESLQTKDTYKAKPKGLW
jgi:hypothetical protein